MPKCRECGASAASTARFCGMTALAAPARAAAAVPRPGTFGDEFLAPPADPAGILFEASERPILCMSVLGNEAALGGSDHGVNCFNIDTGSQTRNLYTKQYGHSEWVTCITHLPDGRILSGGMDSKLCLWDARGVRCSDLKGHGGSVSCVKAMEAGRAVSGAYDRTLRIWDTSRRQELKALPGHAGPVLDIAWGGSSKLEIARGGGRAATPLSPLLVSGSRDSTIRLWDADSGQCVRVLKGHKGHVEQVAILEGMDLILSGAQDGCLRVWDLRSELCAHTMNIHGGGAVTGIAIAPSGAVVTCGADKTVQVLDPSSDFRVLHRFTEHRDFPYSLHVAGRVAFSGDGSGALLAHDIESGRCLYGLGANRAAVRCIQALPSRLVASGDDGTAISFHF
eukprot:tig00000042_g15611.t1